MTHGIMSDPTKEQLAMWLGVSVVEEGAVVFAREYDNIKKGKVVIVKVEVIDPLEDNVTIAFCG